jgi:amidohydrolase
MANVGDLKERVCRAIDAHRDEVCALGEDIRKHPELGYKEFRTAQQVAERFAALGLSAETGLAITGVKTVLRGRAHGPTVAYLGELDSVLVREHPDADPTTGAAHACGHNAQIANLVALAYGLVESGVMAALDGQVALMAAPAEEYVEIEYRTALRAQGAIEFLGGKPELIRLGAFDDVDMALSTHQASDENVGLLGVSGASNGCIVKRVRYLGKAAHAGAEPHSGVNALKAAMLGLQGIDANRETFRDTDHIRVHPIVTKGGALVNVIPDEVILETYVRGASISAILDAEKKVDRALQGGAMALGARVEIATLPGYLPRILHDDLTQAYRANAVALVGEAAWIEPRFGAGSTDMGDLSQIMPAIEACAKGACGTGHGVDYAISDPEMAYITPAKAAAMTLIDLLADGAARANAILARHKPAMARDEYLAFLRRLARTTLWTPNQ